MVSQDQRTDDICQAAAKQNVRALEFFPKVQQHMHFL
jgi:hypothetical protein